MGVKGSWEDKNDRKEKVWKAKETNLSFILSRTAPPALHISPLVPGYILLKSIPWIFVMKYGY